MDKAQDTLLIPLPTRNSEEPKFYMAGKYVEAYVLFLNAANQGDTNALIRIGIMYEKGEGVTQNFEEAKKWYRKAAEQGNADAKNKLEQMRMRRDNEVPEI